MTPCRSQPDYFVLLNQLLLKCVNYYKSFCHVHYVSIRVIADKHESDIVRDFNICLRYKVKTKEASDSRITVAKVDSQNEKKSE